MLLQHPRERDVAIGTARMASLCLPNSELHVGFDWSASAALTRALSDPARPAVLLYPGEGAIDVVEHPPAGPVTLVVVDGTWRLTRKLVRANPAIAALPRYAFRPPAPSEYRIRREPREDFVSTLEALMHVLGALEGDAERFRPLMTPFRAMIDAQIACQATLQGGRVRHPKGPRPARRCAPSPLAGRAEHVVCVAGEASAWPRPSAWPDEVVQWVAHRPSTGDSFEAIAAPRSPLAPGTASQTGVPASRFAAGEDPAAMLARWRAFVRDTDVVCAWGDYATSIFEAAGAYLPAARVDLRKAARAELRGNVGMPAEYLARVGVALGEGERMGHGRAGVRLAQIAAVARHFMG